MMAVHPVREILTTTGTLTAKPWAFLILIGYTVAWIVFEHETLDWHGVATLVTWAMTLLIQRAEHRDTQALQAKLDELIRATGNARNDLTQIDKKEPEEIERKRSLDGRNDEHERSAS
ncbi:low affinity iron permease family protein [Mesorhizobium sp. B2-4-15]|uniref:low affinity iron permease family protein n=1 Tax=Mesorhizobium sp. B2-4-15 TaxID=2589934 RepID=UPI0032B1F89B